MITPLLACVGPAQHGVRMHAQDLASHTAGAEAVAGTFAELRPTLLTGHGPVHLHFTDRVFGASPEAAARAVEEIAAVRPVSVTLHDIPQPSDGHAYAARREAYARVVAGARMVIVCSASERDQLARSLPGPPAVPVDVNPLPVDPPEPESWRAGLDRSRVGGGRLVGAEAGPSRAVAVRGVSPGDDAVPTVAVLGFLYPGKGHDRVVEALAGVGGGLEVLALGRPSDGHEDLVPRLDAAARRHGHSFRATGFLDDAALTRAAQRVTVPVVAPSHVSASGSIGRWISAGRAPIVTPHPFFEELAARAPWALTLTDDLPGALAAALADPVSTWIDPACWDGEALPSTASAAARQWSLITAPSGVDSAFATGSATTSVPGASRGSRAADGTDDGRGGGVVGFSGPSERTAGGGR